MIIWGCVAFCMQVLGYGLGSWYKIEADCTKHKGSSKESAGSVHAFLISDAEASHFPAFDIRPGCRHS